MEALKKLLLRLDLDKISTELRQELMETRSKQRAKDIIKRLKTVEALRDSENRPEWIELTLAAIDCAADDLGSTNTEAFHPRRLRPLVASLRRSTEPWQRVPSALTLTLNRLLGEAHASRETVASRSPLG